jgi:hypothetical protein
MAYSVFSIVSLGLAEPEASFGICGVGRPSPCVSPSTLAVAVLFCAIYVTPCGKNRFVSLKKVFYRLMGLALSPGFVFP